MSTLNRTRIRKPQTGATHEGGTGRKVKAEEELALLALSTFLGDRFYETSDESLARMQKLVNQSRGEFVTQLSRVARQEFNMRATPAALTGFLTLKSGQPQDRRLITDAFWRGDELGDYLAVVEKFSNKGKVIPSAVRFARNVLQDQLSERKALRYANHNREWNLAKIIRLSHARAGADEYHTALFNFILRWHDTKSLSKAWDETPVEEKKQLDFIRQVATGQDTTGSAGWERQRSEGADWTQLVDNMGYMALLRNLRNFLQDVPASNRAFWMKVNLRLRDEEEVRNSRQMPFRFLSAYQEVKATGGDRAWELLASLSEALNLSVENMPDFPDKTLVIVDVSGSMGGTTPSEKSNMTMKDIGLLFASALNYRTGADVVSFASEAKLSKLGQRGVFANYETLSKARVGYATMLQTVNGVVNVHDYDSVVVFSDMQLHDNAQSVFRGYKGKLFTVNLAAYHAQLNVKGSNVFSIAGWSDATLRLMGQLSKGSLVDYIMSYE